MEETTKFFIKVNLNKQLSKMSVKYLILLLLTTNKV
jgi:hypothetical protein